MTFFSECSDCLYDALKEKNYPDFFCLPPSHWPPKKLFVYVCRERDIELPREVETEIFLFPSSASFAVPEGFSASAAVSCGMRETDTLSFSSISETSAMLCLMREIPFSSLTLTPMERKVFYDKKKSIYENLTLAFCLYLVEVLISRKD